MINYILLLIPVICFHDNIYTNTGGFIYLPPYHSYYGSFFNVEKNNKAKVFISVGGIVLTRKSSIISGQNELLNSNMLHFSEIIHLIMIWLIYCQKGLKRSLSPNMIS